MRSYGNADGRQASGLRRSIRRQAKLPAGEITADDLAALEAEARRQLDQNKRLLDLPEQDRGYDDGIRRTRPIRSPGQARRT